VFSGLYLVLAKANKIVFLSSNYSVKPIQFTKPKKNHEKLVLSFDPFMFDSCICSGEER
jgi:hypothetical protein